MPPFSEYIPVLVHGAGKITNRYVCLLQSSATFLPISDPMSYAKLNYDSTLESILLSISKGYVHLEAILAPI